jgi:hypothetical protein
VKFKQHPKYSVKKEVDNKGRPGSVIYGGTVEVILEATVEVKPGDNRPVFHWKANNPGPGQTYSIKIVEINDEQSVEDAVETSTPVFEKKGIKETSFAYPARTSKQYLDKQPTESLASKKYLDKPPVGTLNSKKYAWVVTAWDSSGKQSGQSQRQIILGVNLSF